VTGGVIPDPPARPGDRCAVCRKKLPAAAITNADPFCSTECAKAWHTPRRRAAYWWVFAWVNARKGAA
jgi:predicted nucleic acid-binding Zn ribbon protein